MNFLVNGGGKVTLQQDYLLSMNEDELLLKNYRGKVFRYRNPNPQSRLEEDKTAQPGIGSGYC